MPDHPDDSDLTAGPEVSRRPVPSNARRTLAVVVAVTLVIVTLIGGGLAWAFWSFSRQAGVTTLSESPEPASPPGTVTVGTSTETTVVPDVVSLPLAKASEKLRAAGLATGAVTRVFVDGFALGAVVAQSPAAKADVPLGSAVSLTVSKGNLGAELPRVLGLTVAEAKSALSVAGLSVSKVSYQYSDLVKNGIVISLAADGTRLPQRGDSVSLTASKGRAPVVMPSIIGMTSQAALTACKALGIGLSLQPAGATVGVIYQQSPRAGSDIAVGSSASGWVDLPPQASISARITKIDPTWEKYNNQLGAHITCTSTSTDGRGIASLRWQVQGLDVTASGTGKDISFILPGWRRYGSTTVTLSVVDTAGQTSTTRKIVKVNWDTGTLQ